MVYLAIIVVIVSVIALWMLSARPDPHHTFIISLLPLLDLEHRTGTPRGVDDRVGQANSGSRAAA